MTSGWRWTRRVLAAALLLAPRPSAAATADDVVLFTANVTPNVLIILDNSESMNHIVWHPDFDPAVTPTCTEFNNDDEYAFKNGSTETHCDRTRTIFTDSKAQETLYSGRYLNWLFSPEADDAYAEIDDTGNGFPSSCVGGAAFAKYQRTRITTAKQAIKDIVCEVNLASDVRFGMATFREATDPNGGYVRVEVEEYSSGQAADFDSALQSIKAETSTPLGETLFQAYTYFMSRDLTEVPVGNDGITQFPVYSYTLSKSGTGGGFSADPSKVPPSPVQYSCQKNFIMLITDGDPTRDDFDVESPVDTALGFANFASLIGDYNADGEAEETSKGSCADCESAYYLDDIALYMQTNDFRPDMSDDQVIDTYTVGFVTGATANELLEKTAVVGNGLFRQATTSDELAQAIIDAFVDIIEKSQSFTAATVPATRTAAGGNLYTSLFVPSGDLPYWEGHLQNYQITQSGEIHDKNGDCAVDDPVAGQCFSGPILPDAQPFWDAGKEIPSPASRDLFTSLVDASGDTVRAAFDTSLTAADLGVVYPSVETYAGSTALNAEGLADEIIQNIRGCVFGTGTDGSSDVSSPQVCVERSWRLGAIFHSNPVVVGPPAAFLPDTGYSTFAERFHARDRVIYAGAGDGFLRGFLAGEYDSLTGTHDRGTGEELFGYMPWPGRLTARKKPVDTGNRDYYFVDGSPTVADVWIDEDGDDIKECGASAASGCEWHTVLVSGMRQGGDSYFALDVTDPADSSYPELLWEFPAENGASSIRDFVGETWSEPIITRVRVQSGSNPAEERWVAIVTGGYSASGDPNETAAYSATATKGRGIFVIDIPSGEVLAEKKFDVNGTTPSGDPQREMLYAIPSTPAVFDLDFDGYADVIYVGDLGGNLWKWVIHPVGEDPVNEATASTDQPSWTFRKFFQAPTYQENASAPVYHKSFFFPPAGTFRHGRLWITFGSGERANLTFAGDPDTTEDNNRFYAILDLDPFELRSPALPTLEEGDVDGDGVPELLDVTASADPANLTGYSGYYFVADEKEKFVTNVDIFFHYVIASSYIPTESTDPCETGGESFLYAFRIYNGEGYFVDDANNMQRSIYLGSGLPTDPRVTVGSDGSEESNRVLINKQDGEIVNLQAPPGFGAGIGQFYWRELTQ